MLLAAVLGHSDFGSNSLISFYFLFKKSRQFQVLTSRVEKVRTKKKSDPFVMGAEQICLLSATWPVPVCPLTCGSICRIQLSKSASPWVVVVSERFSEAENLQFNTVAIVLLSCLRN